MQIRKETRLRSFVKVSIWRISGVPLLGLVSYAVIFFIPEKKINQCLSITLIFNAIRLVMQYIYERIWQRIKWGWVVKEEN